MGQLAHIVPATVLALFAGAGLLRFKGWLFSAPAIGLERIAVYIGVGVAAVVIGRDHIGVMASVWLPAGLIAAGFDRLRHLLPKDDGEPTI